MATYLNKIYISENCTHLNKVQQIYYFKLNNSVTYYSLSVDENRESF